MIISPPQNHLSMKDILKHLEEGRLESGLRALVSFEKDHPTLPLELSDDIHGLSNEYHRLKRRAIRRILPPEQEQKDKEQISVRAHALAVEIEKYLQKEPQASSGSSSGDSYTFIDHGNTYSGSVHNDHSQTIQAGRDIHGGIGGNVSHGSGRSGEESTSTIEE